MIDILSLLVDTSLQSITHSPCHESSEGGVWIEDGDTVENFSFLVNAVYDVKN